MSRAAVSGEDHDGPAFKRGDRVQVVNRKSYRAGDIGAVELVDLDALYAFVDVDFGGGDICRYGPSALAPAPPFLRPTAAEKNEALREQLAEDAEVDADHDQQAAAEDEAYARLAATQDDEDRAFHEAVRARRRRGENE